MVVMMGVGGDHNGSAEADVIDVIFLRESREIKVLLQLALC